MLQLVKNTPVITADLCVIEEQGEHLVLAVRVPRAAIENNRDLLAYLCGVSAEPVAPARPAALVAPAKPVEPARTFPRLRSWAAAAAIALLSITTWEYGETNIFSSATATRGPAFVWGSARFVHDVIPQNSVLEIIASHKYLKPCDWSVTRRWYRNESLIAVTKVSLPAIPVSEEFSTKKWTVELPEQLEPGSYNFKAQLHGVCPDEIFEQEVFEQNFRLLAAPPT